MKTMRVVKALRKNYLSFAIDGVPFLEIPMTDDQVFKLSVENLSKESGIMQLEENQQKYVKIGEKIAFFDDIYGILMVSKVIRIIHSSDWMVTAADNYQPREFTLGIPDDRFVFFAEHWHSAVYGNQILRNVRHIDKVIDQLIPDILP